MKLSKTQIYKIKQSCGFLSRLLGPLLSIGLPVLNNVLKPLAKSVLIPLGLTAAASAADTRIKNSNIDNFKQKMEDTKMVESLQETGSLIKGASETFEN